MSQADIEKPARLSVSTASAVGIAVAVVLALLFVASRILGVYWLQYSTNGDYTVVLLMAKRIAAGAELPLFFYGQAYMGSLEPIVSALLCRIAGFSPFSVCMGTVVFSVAMIPFVYLLGKECRDRWAGLAALAFCVIGPSGFFHYACSPRGGYAALIFFTVLILWGLLKITAREVQGRKVSIWAYLGIGLAGGVAWWTDPLVSPAILAGAIIYVIYLWPRAFKAKGPYAAGLGFLLGMIPFFEWNITNGWKSLLILEKESHAVDFQDGLELFFVRCASLLDLHLLPSWLRLLATALYLGCFVLFVKAVVKALRADRRSQRSICLVGIFTFLAVFAVCFAVSDFATVNTPRYLLPLVPALGAVIAVAILDLKGWKRYVGLLFLAAVVCYQGVRLKIFAEMAEKSKIMLKQSEELSDYLVKNEVKYIYGGFSDKHLNYFLDENVLICNSGAERYRPYLEQMERAPDAAVLNSAQKVEHFLSAIRADFKVGGPHSYTVHHSIKRRLQGASGIERSRVASITDILGNDLSGRLLDRCLLTGWSGVNAAPGVGQSLTVSFKQPEEVSGIRFLCDAGRYPASWRLRGRLDGSEEWVDLTGEVDVTSLMWSGDRVFARGPYFRAEGECEPTRCTQLKLLFPGLRGSGLRLSELQFLVTPDSPAPDDGLPIEELAVWLERNGVQKVYADRWEANQLDGSCDCDVVHVMPGEPGSDTGVPVVMTPGTAFVIRKGDAAWTRGVLADYSINMSRTDVGPWTVFAFGQGQWKSEFADTAGMVWVGFGCAMATHKHRALALARLAEREYLGEGRPALAIDHMKSALTAYPNYRDGTAKLSRWLSEQGRGQEAAYWLGRCSSMWTPPVKAQVEFGRSVTLLGISSSKLSGAPGEVVDIEYYWKCEPSEDLRNLVVFVHFKGGKDILFQDDRPLLEDQSITLQPFSEVFVEHRQVRIPLDVPAGSCDVWLGLYDVSAANKRLAVKTKLPDVHRRAVRLPLVVDVLKH